MLAEFDWGAFGVAMVIIILSAIGLYAGQKNG